MSVDDFGFIVKPLRLQRLFRITGEQNYFFSIPFFQREFSWNGVQITKLLEQLNSAEQNGHFIGTIFTAANGPREEIIDGQQRLTTLSLISIALHHYIESKDPTEIFKQQLEFLKKSVFIIGDEQVSTPDDYSGDEPLKYRIQLGNQNKNYYDYKLLVNDVFRLTVQIDASLARNYKSRKLYRAYAIISDWLKANLLEETDIRAFVINLYNTRMVVLSSTSLSNASELFEGLNNTGLQLSVADIIKNKVLSSYMSPDNVTSYVSSRQAYDEWVRFADAIPVALHTQYLKHLSYTLPSVVGVHNQFQLPSLADRAVAEIYGKLLNAAKETQKKDKIIYKIAEHAINYSFFCSDSIEFHSTEYRNKLYELQTIGASPAYSLLLYLKEKQCDEQLILQVLDLLIKIFVRRHVVNDPRVDTLDDIITTTIRILENESVGTPYILFDRITNLLLGGYKLPQTALVNSRQIKKAYAPMSKLKLALESNIYQRNAEMTRYLLQKIAVLQRRKTYGLENSFQEFMKYEVLEKPGVRAKRIFTIEHVMPQNENLNESWISSLRATCPIEKSLLDWQNEHIHKLGNLTLSASNSSLSDSSFSVKQKKSAITIDGIPYDIGYQNRDTLNELEFASGESLAKSTKWDTTLINQRTTFMVDTLLNWLRLPNEQSE